MKKNLVTNWEAEDGTIFNTKEKCIEYEKKEIPLEILCSLFEKCLVFEDLPDSYSIDKEKFKIRFEMIFSLKIRNKDNIKIIFEEVE